MNERTYWLTCAVSLFPIIHFPSEFPDRQVCRLGTAHWPIKNVALNRADGAFFNFTGTSARALQGKTFNSNTTHHSAFNSTNSTTCTTPISHNHFLSLGSYFLRRIHRSENKYQKMCTPTYSTNAHHNTISICFETLHLSNISTKSLSANTHFLGKNAFGLSECSLHSGLALHSYNIQLLYELTDNN